VIDQVKFELPDHVAIATALQDELLKSFIWRHLPSNSNSSKCKLTLWPALKKCWLSTMSFFQLIFPTWITCQIDYGLLMSCSLVSEKVKEAMAAV